MPITSAWAVVSARPVHRAPCGLSLRRRSSTRRHRKAVATDFRETRQAAENLRHTLPVQQRRDSRQSYAQASQPAERDPSWAGFPWSQRYSGHRSFHTRSLEWTQLPGGWRGPYRRVQAAKPACGRRERVISRPAASPLRSRNPSGVVRGGSHASSGPQISGRHFSGGRRYPMTTERADFRQADGRNILCNAIDQPPRCHFGLPRRSQGGERCRSLISRLPDSARRSPNAFARNQPSSATNTNSCQQAGRVRAWLVAQRHRLERRKRLLHRLASRQSFERDLSPRRLTPSVTRSGRMNGQGLSGGAGPGTPTC